MLSRQPFKGVYTVLFVLHLFIRVPLLGIYYIPHRLRQYPGWSYKRALAVAITRVYLNFLSTVEMREVPSLEAGAEKDRFVVLKPAYDSSYTGVCKDEQVKPVPIGGVWYPKSHSKEAKEDRDYILHFHGGAYVIFSGREKDSGYPARTLSRGFDDALVLCPEYRLATGKNCHFPAALQDAVTAYRYFLDDLNIPPSKIVLSGDSAGGNLVLALLRYAQETNDVPLPKGAMIWSPWVNVSDTDISARSKNRDVDFIGTEITGWGAKALTNGHKISVSSPYISPFQAPFKSEVPLFISACGAESMYESIVQFAEKMKGVGGLIKLNIVDDAPHDLLAIAEGLDFQEEVASSVIEAKEFIGTGC